jgi:hypothetical protein
MTPRPDRLAHHITRWRNPYYFKDEQWKGKPGTRGIAQYAKNLGLTDDAATRESIEFLAHAYESMTRKVSDEEYQRETQARVLMRIKKYEYRKAGGNRLLHPVIIHMEPELRALLPRFQRPKVRKGGEIVVKL